ncbi:MAG: hypothetical protein IJG24_02780 [Selenomonadaceae bacterium]|nr:hypothetical protein [Selenomonadaceae bacterium]
MKFTSTLYTMNSNQERSSKSLGNTNSSFVGLLPSNEQPALPWDATNEEQFGSFAEWGEALAYGIGALTSDTVLNFIVTATIDLGEVE